MGRPLGSKNLIIKRITKVCSCGKSFLVCPSKIKVGRGKYCSRFCSFKAMKGRISPRKGQKCSEESKKKMSDAHIGRPSNRKGKKATDETKQKSRESHMGLLSGEKILCMVNIIQKKLKRK